MNPDVRQANLNACADRWEAVSAMVNCALGSERSINADLIRRLMLIASGRARVISDDYSKFSAATLIRCQDDQKKDTEKIISLLKNMVEARKQENKRTRDVMAEDDSVKQEPVGVNEVNFIVPEEAFMIDDGSDESDFDNIAAEVCS